MAKTMRNILTAFFILAFICFLFWKIGWIGGWGDVLTVYLILAAVIAVHIVKGIIVSHIKTKRR